MSEEQLSALLAKLRDDAGLREKLQGIEGLDALVAIAKEAGFDDVSQADWMKYQVSQSQELSDEELESVAGGAASHSTCYIIGSVHAYGICRRF
ncbi:MAG: Nif11-like leader peptide family natural product precursor [Cyanobacteria bacterium]|nr:Nif11-like leader peptide family natural product precursor [Cyanobacteriota bacterium]